MSQIEVTVTWNRKRLKWNQRCAATGKLLKIFSIAYLRSDTNYHAGKKGHWINEETFMFKKLKGEISTNNEEVLVFYRKFEGPGGLMI